MDKLARTLGPALLLSPALLLAALQPACVDNNSTLYVRQVQAPDPDSSCVVAADPSSLFYGYGVMDADLTTSYSAALLVGNQLQSRGDVATQRTESAKVTLYEAEVEVYDFAGATLSAFTMPVSGFVDEASGTSASYGLATVVLVDPAVGAGVAPGQTIVARTKIYGETTGGLEVETGWFDYPIYVCSGCLGCVCPESTEAEYYMPCNVGNNESIDCRLHPCWPNCGCQLN